MSITIEPIGRVSSPVTDPVDTGWGDVVSEVRLRPDLAAGLTGLESFSHVIVVFWMHDAAFDLATQLTRHHRGRADMPETGIFAQRARHRPNRIGITPVKLLGVDGANITVRGLDAIDGTPVLDVKPYMPVFDRVDDATVPEYIDRLMADYF
ncbi:MAG: tRNA (N6-threonylcarbamoyladenosine(37)-N6)-methyltransferase TrmO [Chloroflexi bacterium]|nr:tRNA (N6-threonylcarbamoyladenosine(37)-N6)-methyltransferase TrmO [Chloroflexota bacterium]